MVVLTPFAAAVEKALDSLLNSTPTSTDYGLPVQEDDDDDDDD